MRDEDDGADDSAESWIALEEAYTDFVAERTAAFGILVTRTERVEDPELRELCRIMLKAIIRSIRTPPGADVSEISH